MSSRRQSPPLTGLRRRLHDIIFEADTPAGKAFDIALLLAILLSVGVVMLESVAQFSARHGDLLHALEWSFTILFTLEYALRIYSVARPTGYIGSFFGVVDLLSFLPTYLSYLLPGAQSFQIIRALRLLRIFRVLKLGHYVQGAEMLMKGVKASRPKITVFVIVVLNIACICGTLMYLVEGESAGFSNIPISVYWAIVTMTTVGYGDLAPQSPTGQIIASVLMIMGYGIIAVPTGIVTSELIQTNLRGAITTEVCPSCMADGHDSDAVCCKYCGARLN